MTINQRVFDTAIATRSNCSRAIGMDTANPANDLFYVDQDNTLIAGTAVSFAECYVKSSSDNGFQWDIDTLVYVGARGDSPQGPCIALFVPPDGYDGYIFAYCYNNRIWWVFTDTAVLDSLYGEVTTKYGLFNRLILSNFFASSGDAKTFIYCVFLDANEDLCIIGVDVKRAFADMLQDYTTYGTTNFRQGALACKSHEELVHILCIPKVTDELSYAPFYKKQGNGTGHFSGLYTVHAGDLPGGDTSFVDLGIDVAASGTGHAIGVVYGVRNGNPGTDLSGYYAISWNGGSVWTSVYNPPPSGYTFYTNSVNSKVSTGGDIIGGYSGSFLISQMFMKDNSGYLFVKEVDGTNYTTSGSYKISNDEWRQVNSVSGNVLGGKFFKHTNEVIPNFGDKSAIRMAYNVGNQNSADGQDSVSNRIYHERLSNLAYPSEYSGNAPYCENYDYYASGLYDSTSDLYISKLEELGAVYNFTKYDPLEGSETTGRGAYDDPVTISGIACIDPGAYAFATVARNNSDFSDYIERDTRKIFYKPNMFLDRKFVLNNGGFLKRTIWTVRFMGNDYEIAQIVPRFLNGKIIFYEANLYVIGPSNDPFTKLILPSET